MSDWPATLPLPSQSYTLTVAETAIVTEFDSTRIRQSRALTDSVMTISVQWEFNADEYTTFCDFVNVTLYHGSDWMDIPLITGDSVIDHSARFVGGEYRASHKPDNNYTVSAQLETFDLDCFANANETMYYWYDLATVGPSIHEALMSFLE